MFPVLPVVPRIWFAVHGLRFAVYMEPAAPGEKWKRSNGERVMEPSVRGKRSKGKGVGEPEAPG